MRLSMGGDGEIYIMSKSDGMIRKMMAVVTPLRRTAANGIALAPRPMGFAWFLLAKLEMVAACIRLQHTCIVLLIAYRIAFSTGITRPAWRA